MLGVTVTVGAVRIRRVDGSTKDRFFVITLVRDGRGGEIGGKDGIGGRAYVKPYGSKGGKAPEGESLAGSSSKKRGAASGERSGVVGAIHAISDRTFAANGSSSSSSSLEFGSNADRGGAAAGDTPRNSCSTSNASCASASDARSSPSSELESSLSDRYPCDLASLGSNKGVIGSIEGSTTASCCRSRSRRRSAAVPAMLDDLVGSFDDMTEIPLASKEGGDGIGGASNLRADSRRVNEDADFLSDDANREPKVDGVRSAGGAKVDDGDGGSDNQGYWSSTGEAAVVKVGDGGVYGDRGGTWTEVEVRLALEVLFRRIRGARRVATDCAARRGGGESPASSPDGVDPLPPPASLWAPLALALVAQVVVDDAGESTQVSYDSDEQEDAVDAVPSVSLARRIARRNC